METPKVPTTKSWAMDKIGKPLMFIGIGFILSKVFDAYTEGKRVKRLGPQ